MSFKCEKCLKIFDNEMALKMHLKKCGLNSVEQEKRKTIKLPDVPAGGKRTTAVTIASVLLTIQGILLLPILGEAVVSTDVKLLSRIMCILIGVCIITAMTGLWQMKKQGLYAYLFFTLFSQLFFIVMVQNLSPKSFIFSIVIICLGASGYNEME
ncbi:MAG: hypothetical protein WA705_03735 [Candidatus Ozemobacteraceae bacterium]